MKDLSVWVVAIIAIAGGLRFVYQIWEGTIDPALSTWIIFFTATSLSLTTYALAENHDFRSGINNTMDVIETGMILGALLVWGNRKIRFRSFEKWYLGSAGAIVAYGFLSGDAWNSNLFTQALISVGYGPTLQKLIQNKKNTESYIGWSCAFAVGVVGLYPASIGGNTLAMVYALRTIVLVGGVLSLMTYFEWHTRISRFDRLRY